jgi:hypothetical protein
LARTSKPLVSPADGGICTSGTVRVPPAANTKLANVVACALPFAVENDSSAMFAPSAPKFVSEISGV